MGRGRCFGRAARVWYNRAMHIAIDASRAVRARPTGTEAYSWHLIRALHRARPEAAVSLYSPTPLPPDFLPLAPNTSGDTRTPQQRGWQAHSVPFPRLWTHLRLNLALRRDRPDLLFVPSHVLPIGCPVAAVVTVHDLGYHYYPEAHPALDRWYLEWTTRRHARLAACVLADSQATRDDLCRHYAADPRRVRVVYPGRDERLRRVTDPTALAAVRQRYGIQGDYLLYLGTLQPRKNLARLVEAFAAVAERVQLVLAGRPGWLCADLAAQAERLGLGRRVILTGYVPPEDKAALLSGALALVFPSLYEGFGMPVVEAMACGVPVLTSTVSSLPEVAGDAALLVDPLSPSAIAAGMSRLVGDAGLRQTLAERGTVRAQRFSWAEAARQVWEVFDSLAR